MNKRGKITGLIISLIFLVIILIGIVMFFSSRDNLCNQIDNERLLDECNSCEEAYDSVDCQDRVYIRYAISKKDISLCENLIRDYNIRDCTDNKPLFYSTRGGIRP